MAHLFHPIAYLLQKISDGAPPMLLMIVKMTNGARSGKDLDYRVSNLFRHAGVEVAHMCRGQASWRVQPRPVRQQKAGLAGRLKMLCLSL